MAETRLIILDNNILYEFYRFFPQNQPKEKCWIWQGCISKDKGYGRFSACSGLGKSRDIRRDYLAHRISYMIHNELKQFDGLVLHDCQPNSDNRACVNPRHLYCGTTKQNAIDRSTRGNQVRGSKDPSSKLTEENILKIRFDYKHDMWFNLEDQANKYGVSTMTIRRVLNGIWWKHI